MSVTGPTSNVVDFDGSNYVAKFIASGDLVLGGSAGTYKQFDYLTVAGGGGGGSSCAGGGAGAGGFRTSFPGGTKIYLQESKVHQVLVGAGGAGAPGGAKNGTNGSNSAVGLIANNPMMMADARGRAMMKKGGGGS